MFFALSVCVSALQNYTQVSGVNIFIINELDAYQNPIAVEDSNTDVHLIWRDNLNDMRYEKLNLTGTVLVPEKVIINITGTGNAFSIGFPDVGVDSSNNLHLVWSQTDVVHDNYQVYYKKLDSNGDELVSDTALTSSPSNQIEYGYPKIAVGTDNMVNVIWTKIDNQTSFNDTNPLHGQIHYIKLDSSGNINVSDTIVKHNGSYNTRLALDTADNDIYILTLEDYNNLTDPIAGLSFTRLDENGTVVAGPVNVTDTSNILWGYFDIDVDNSGDAHIVWSDNRTGAALVWYSKLDENGSIIVGNKSISSNTSSLHFAREPTVGVKDNNNILVLFEGVDFRNSTTNANHTGIYKIELSNAGSIVQSQTLLMKGVTNPFAFIGDEGCVASSHDPDACRTSSGEGEGEEVPEFSSVFTMLLLVIIALAVFVILKKKKGGSLK